MKPRSVSIRTIGGAGHGKSTLVRAILKELHPGDFDRRNRNSFGTSHHKFITAAKRYAIHDIPAGYVAKSFCDSPCADGAILVVSAVEGVTSETRKHVWLAKWFGTRNLIPFLNKCDLAYQPNELLRTKRQIRTLLHLNGFRAFDMPVIHGSAADCLNRESPECNEIKSLLDVLDRTVFSPYA